jgi:hypothetical protein
MAGQRHQGRQPLLRSSVRHLAQLPCDILLPVSNAGITHIVVFEFAGVVCLYRPPRSPIVIQLNDLSTNRTSPRRHHRSPVGAPALYEQRKSTSPCGHLDIYEDYRESFSLGPLRSIYPHAGHLLASVAAELRSDQIATIIQGSSWRRVFAHGIRCIN